MYTKTLIIKKLKEKSTELGRPPLSKEMINPSYQTIIRKFGSFNQALIEACLDVKQMFSYTDDELLKSLKGYLCQCHKTPQTKDIPHYATINKRFKGIENAAEIIGFGYLFEDWNPHQKKKRRY